MFNSRKLSVLVIAFGMSIPVIASNWIDMQLVGEDWGKQNYNTSSGWISCTYTTNGFSGSEQRISIRTSEISCPNYIKYNPETNKWTL